jgi:hypothetical protein
MNFEPSLFEYVAVPLLLGDMGGSPLTRGWFDGISKAVKEIGWMMMICNITHAQRSALDLL